MAYLDTLEPTPPRVSPQLMVGAASPLWSYFAAAAAGGVAFWWMTRWTRPVNLEALFDPAMTPLAPAVLPEPILEPVVDAVAEVMMEAAEAAGQTVETVLAAPVEAAAKTLAALEPEPAPDVLAPIGGEAAPFSAPLAELALVEPETVVEPESEPVIEAAPEAIPEPVLEAAPEPEPAPLATEAKAEAMTAPKLKKPKKATPPEA